MNKEIKKFIHQKKKKTIQDRKIIRNNVRENQAKKKKFKHKKKKLNKKAKTYKVDHELKY